MRNYDEFCLTLIEKGLPEFVSFDHDLADEHYRGDIDTKEAWEEYHRDERREYTGLDCAKFLIFYCRAMGKKPLPDYAIHSMNPVGTENIKNELEAFRKKREE